ncbi:hypothetical protein Q0N12_16335 [Rossellomorea marisflavi]|uniref:hypothetical protein n=1 Tax=Rossellomorea marisflavi TaxID=189381 RepID=UPI00345A4CD7
MKEKKVRKPWHKKWWVWALIVFFGFAALGAIVDEGEDVESAKSEENSKKSESAEKKEAAEPTKKEVTKEEKEETKPKEEKKAKSKPKQEKKVSAVEVTDFAIQQAIELTESDSLVQDAAVNVEGDTIYLAIIAPAVNKEYGKELGDNFVRQLAAFSEGESPTKDYYGEIYDNYNMQVGVFDANEKAIVYGAKVTSSPKITW